MAGTLTERRYADLSHRDWFVQETFGRTPCDACGDRPVVVRAEVMIPESELKAIDLGGFIACAYGEPAIMKRSVSSERYYNFATHVACAQCQRDMERMMVHRYSSATFVHFVRAPTDRLVMLAG